MTPVESESPTEPPREHATFDTMTRDARWRQRLRDAGWRTEESEPAPPEPARR